MGRLLSVNVGLTARHRVARQDCPHRHMEDAGSKARAWCGGSTSTATGKGTWPAMAANTGPSSSIRSTPIAIGRANSVETTSPTDSSARISPSTACPTQEVCIGDRYRIGGALFEVTQPRVTCYRVGIRMNEPQMAALLVAHGRPGFYFRVLEEGEVEAGDEIMRVAAGPERMSVAEIDALLYMPGHPRDRLERALRIPALSAGWRASFEALLSRSATAARRQETPGSPRRPARRRRGADSARCGYRARCARAAT